VGTDVSARREQTRARYPDHEGFVERDGVRVFYEVYGAAGPTVLLLPTWAIIHSRHWKMQIPYLSRHCRVVTFDGRGNGRSDRPGEPAAYAETEYAADAIAVMDATDTASATVVSFSLGALRALLLAANHPDRVDAAVFIGPAYPGGGQPLPERDVYPWDAELDTDQGWAKYNKHVWLRDYEGFLGFFMSRVFTEAHSTKQIEDLIGWGRQTSGATLVHAQQAPEITPTQAEELARRLQCPVLVIHGHDDAIVSHTRGAALADHTGADLVLLGGSGHAPHVRDPVKVNLLLREAVASPPPPRRWLRGRSRPKRVLYVSSPIGLGHAQRDVAIADELRKLHPGVEIDWLAQHPVTTVLQRHGERIHPASRLLATESHHIESESAEHDLHCFQALRRMDEILLANFMVFHDVVRDEQYDIWVGDEAWELDYYLHENPEQKNAAYVWLTDFVGWLPMPDGGKREAFLTADYNAEMIEHIARYPRLRDRAIFVGNSDDVVPDAFGPDLPLIRDWTKDHYDFSGYITGFDPGDFADRAALRAQLGYHDDEQVCIVTVGGSGVGAPLLRRVVDAFPLAKQRVPALRMVVVAGPRIDPSTLAQAEGLEVHAYVHGLYRHLAACDLAVVQGGLTTAMELTANRRPFLYFPMRHHFEQNFHVRHRLARYGAGRCMDFDTATPDVIATAIAREIGRSVDYRGVETDGAATAARLIAEVL
jgi:pimeloyl-ACP methyl ester carboxylesterase/predicted glycosyltransferase